jgi:hypothetical protein
MICKTRRIKRRESRGGKTDRAWTTNLIITFIQKRRGGSKPQNGTPSALCAGEVALACGTISP